MKYEYKFGVRPIPSRESIAEGREKVLARLPRNQRALVVLQTPTGTGLALAVVGVNLEGQIDTIGSVLTLDSLDELDRLVCDARAALTE